MGQLLIARNCTLFFAALLVLITVTAVGQVPIGGGVVVQGVIQSKQVPLPGTIVSAASIDNPQAPPVTGITDVAGRYLLRLSRTGKYRLTAEMTLFTSVEREIDVADGTKPFQANFELVLAPRTQRTAAPPRSSSVPVDSATEEEQEARLAAELQAAPPDIALLPGMSANGATESVAIAGNTVAPSFGGAFDVSRLAEFDTLGFGGPGGLGGPAAGNPGFGDPAAAGQPGGIGGGPGGRGGPGGADAGGRGGARGGPGGFGPGGGPGGPGGGQGGGRGGRGGGGQFVLGGQRGRGNVNPININLGYTLSGSAFDAAPYSLKGGTAQKPSYSQNRLNFTIGGPLAIPKLLTREQNNFTLTYNLSRSRSPYDQFTTVPTLAERAGDFSQTLVRTGPSAGAPVQVFNPQTGLPFANNQIPASAVNSAAAGLLTYVPEPNLPGNTQNFHYVTSNKNNGDDINFRFTHNFANPAQQRGQRGARGGGGGGGRGGGGRGGRGAGTLNVGIQFRSQDSVSNNPFPTIGGTNSTTGWSVPVTYARQLGRLTSNFRFTVNRNRTTSTNLFAYERNIAGDLGILGVSQDPFDWGLPSLSFTNYSSLNDLRPSLRDNRTYQTGAQFGLQLRRHNLRFGMDLTRTEANSHTGSNARGTFTFTGAATGQTIDGVRVAGTGLDFADFLLGLPQLTAVQYGANTFEFRSNSWAFFLQDDWRLRSNLTVNIGLRYEYAAPLTETGNRMVNLDAASDFSAVAPVTPGDIGPFTGLFPRGLVDPDRNNLAPRIGIAWRAFSRIIVRAGYGISYNNGAYNSMAQQFAFQPPYNVTQTNIASATLPLTLQNGFPALPPATVTNNFGVDRGYRIGYAQQWNLNLQRDLPSGLMMSVDYTGTKGTRLDVAQAPNRTATGLRIANVQPFTWETSVGNSILHAGTIQVRRRLQYGFSTGGTYTWSKSIDNASSFNGGSGQGVAQDAFNLALERGPSSFDQRHRFSGDYLWELPFGQDRPFLGGGGKLSRVLGDWQLNGTISFGSGMPFTPRVLGSSSDISRGTNGTLRANYNGDPVSIGNPSVAAWFNTAAFSVPAPGVYGSAGRNIIRGPGSRTFDMSLNKNIRLSGNRGMDIRIQANNVFNIVQYRGIDTTVNSTSFGKVTSAGSMRKIQIVARYRF